MKKSYFFLSATLAAMLLLLVVLLILLASGYRFRTETIAGYGRVSFYGKSDHGTVYLEGTTAEFTKNKLVFANGDVYEGELKSYLPNGNGCYRYGSGDVYEGEFKNGLPDGTGIYTFKNGDFFSGRLSQGAFTEGSLTVTVNGVTKAYTGQFEKSNFSSQFSYLFLDGTYYEGGYHNGLPNGTGKAVLPNGDVYEGDFKDGCFSGFGKYTFSDGSVLTCYFENGKPNGYGSYTYYENGSEKILKGNFFDGYYLKESES